LRAAGRWAEELEAWHIPDSILDQAPESPWGFPPALFDSRRSPVGTLHRVAREALGEGGTVLDVGCGGGAASVPLAAVATELVGVDDLREMLELFAGAAADAGVGHREVQGTWPEVEDQVPSCDVVVCRNVVYNVSDIVPFLTALSRRARRRVVVELTEAHPSVPMGPLWMKFWGLPRPAGPTAALFADVLREMGYDASLETETRPSVKATTDPHDYVAFVRRRLCLDASRDNEIAAALDDVQLPFRDATTAVVFSWAP
jgi:SAM-dependent methyltransferase